MNDKKKTYYIGQLSDDLGLSQRAIRYYEEIGLLRPTRTEGGFRLYSKHDADTLRTVMKFKDLGMSLDEIRALFPSSEESLSGEVITKLRHSLKTRRDEFESKVKRYEEGIEQIDSVLRALSACASCGKPNIKGLCETCLLERNEQSGNITTFIPSLLPDDKN